jgi:hypothetical protein
VAKTEFESDKKDLLFMFIQMIGKISVDGLCPHQNRRDMFSCHKSINQNERRNTFNEKVI